VTRIHIVSLPHTLITRANDWCAYTAKVRRFVAMLAQTKHETYVYGPDVHACPMANEYIPVVFEADRVEWFGAPEWDRNKVFDRWDTDDVCWQTMNTRAADEIRERWRPGDLLGLIGGLCQKQIVDELADLKPLVVEWGIGYSGVLDNSCKVFESYAWMHHVAGLRRQDSIAYFDDVIPNCFDPRDFAFRDRPGEYLLFMGRPNPRKGLPIIKDLVERVGVPLVIAGQPGPETEGIPNSEHVGIVTGAEKAALLAGALATLVPTTYLEPFGGVAVESMLSGTPVIATDWGAFTETVVHGVTGYRCRMLHEFIDAVEQCESMDRFGVRHYAMARWTTDVGAGQYDRYLNRVATLNGPGWYAPADDAYRTFV
jgi:glycosyltransferase involved in cell wall biosynthesis